MTMLLVSFVSFAYVLHGPAPLAPARTTVPAMNEAVAKARWLAQLDNPAFGSRPRAVRTAYVAPVARAPAFAPSMTSSAVPTQNAALQKALAKARKAHKKLMKKENMFYAGPAELSAFGGPAVSKGW
jgi:hypothetical protein